MVDPIRYASKQDFWDDKPVTSPRPDAALPFDSAYHRGYVCVCPTGPCVCNSCEGCDHLRRVPAPPPVDSERLTVNRIMDRCVHWTSDYYCNPAGEAEVNAELAYLYEIRDVELPNQELASRHLQAKLDAARDERDYYKPIADKLARDIDVAWQARDQAEAERDALRGRVAEVAERWANKLQQLDNLAELRARQTDAEGESRAASRAYTLQRCRAELLALTAASQALGGEMAEETKRG